MKNTVLEFLRNLPKEKHEQFNEGFKLYRDSPNKNVSTERSLNAGGYSERALENLLYDLQKLHDITDVEKETIEIDAIIFKDSEIKDINDIDVEHTDIDDNAYVKELTVQNENLALEKQELETDKENLEYEKEELEAENEALKEEVETLKLAPKIDNQSIRVEFPFLNNPDCPDEFKILIADKITAWNRYLELQEQIDHAESGKTAVSNEDLAIIGSEAVKCFDDNQKIYDELNCYQTTGKILGVHPLFRKLRLTREVEIMTTDELIKYKGSSAKYLSVNKTALEKAKKDKDAAKILEIETRVSERQDKLFLVNKKLGL